MIDPQYRFYSPSGELFPGGHILGTSLILNYDDGFLLLAQSGPFLKDQMQSGYSQDMLTILGRKYMR